MAATPIAFSTKDNASGQLASGLSAVSLSIPLDTGDGAAFPQPYTGAATSGGSSTALNSTGISAAIGGSAAAGKQIWNKTDGSVAVIVTVNTNDLVTTRLLGGSDNTWQSADVWCIDPFVLTLEKVSTNAYGVQSTTQREEVLVTARSTDTLSVPTGGRGYNGTVANTFDASDYAYLHVTSPIVERVKDILSVMAQQQDTDRTTLAAEQTNIDNIQSNATFYYTASGSSNAYTITTSGLPAAYTASERIFVKANHTNSGSATINRDGLGAKTIKKNDGATNLSASDWVNGQIAEFVYDGTNYQMVSPTGTPSTQTYYDKTVYLSGASSTALTNPTSATQFNTHAYTIPGGSLTASVGYEFEAAFSVTHGTNSTCVVGVDLGESNLFNLDFASASGATRSMHIRGFIVGTAAAGASVEVRGSGSGSLGLASSFTSGAYAAGNRATNGDLALEFAFTFGTSNGSNSVTMTMLRVRKISTSAFA